MGKWDKAYFTTFSSFFHTKLYFLEGRILYVDFFQVRERSTKKGNREVYPDFKVCRSKDLMIRGKAFYAIWDEEKNLWSTDEYDVARLVDDELYDYANKLVTDDNIHVKSLSDFSSKSWVDFKNYISRLSDNAHQLDTKITFLNTPITKKDYVSRKLSYSLERGECKAYDELMDTLYSEEERRKIEWAIGAIISGEAKHIQKFIVLYGEGGTGKSTVLNIIQSLFEGYYTIFDAKALTTSSNAFSTEAFKANPLVAIQHDGDLSKIEDNTKLNSIVSHEEIIINEKYKSSYPSRANCFLFMATNKPVKITDAKSGIIRRLIDVRPTGKKVPKRRYDVLMQQINFELGAIAQRCLDVFEDLGKNYYSVYRPVDMMYKTDPFFNYVEYYYEVFKDENEVSLKKAYSLYKTYCDETNADYKLQLYKFREELKNYFERYDDDAHLSDGRHIRSYYSGFITEKFERGMKKEEETINPSSWLSFSDDIFDNVFDRVCSECPAQYASTNEAPLKPWDRVKTNLKDIRSTKLHYVRVPQDIIVIDFDKRDEKGDKSLELNIKEAEKWPETYAELSKSGAGIHLHYFYEGDVNELSRIFADNIEIKVFTGKSSLRRKLTKCNRLPIAMISSGLPLKKGAKVVNFDRVKSEKGLRSLILRNLKKEIHPGTKPSIDFIVKILDDAYNSDLKYDVIDLRPSVLAFAANSTHQANYCISKVNEMHFRSKDEEEGISPSDKPYSDDIIIFFDVEVFPNLLLVNWKKEGSANVFRMINPKPKEIEELLKFKLVGFNNRRYDNHILYARLLGYDNEQLYSLSQRIINGSSNCFFGEAYNLSYADLYDICSVKQSLKKWEIKLGIHHQELGMPWDQPVDPSLWEKVAEYCDNDVIATEALWHDRKADIDARRILAELSGLTVNDTTRMHATRIIFGNDRNPSLVYTDLSEMFPGYVFKEGKSYYRGEETGEGGYVYAEPGMYGNVAVLDIASMHPSSIIALNLFGSYTERFDDILKARLAIKHHDYEKAGQMLNGALVPYLESDEQADGLASALKIVINSVYGFTTATFDNPFKDPRNVDNIVAKRGALFMVNLKNEVQNRGYTVAHIKTDSIKIPDATPEIIEFVMDYGRQYGYTFEHEATYDRMCLVNDAVYIAKYKDGPHWDKDFKKELWWTATGAQFKVPYVFKTLFSKDPIEFKDVCETKTVTSSLYLDMNEKFNDPEKHDYHFVGKAGLFTPIKPGCGGGILLREKDGKYYAVTGTKGYRWLESESVKLLGKEEDVDEEYYLALVDAAIKTIDKFGDFEWFVSDEPYISPPFTGGKIIAKEK